MVRVGSARIDENGKVIGGQAGDQTGHVFILNQVKIGPSRGKSTQTARLHVGIKSAVEVPTTQSLPVSNRTFWESDWAAHRIPAGGFL